MGLTIGFTTGDLRKYMNPKEAIHFAKEIGCNAVELGFVKKERIKQGLLDPITASDLEGFSFVSFHAPKVDYGQNNETQEMFAKIEKVHAMRPLDLVIFHPDTILDVNVFKKVSFPVGFENMDNSKKTGQMPEDLEKILDIDPEFKFILDLNHAKVNDNSMELAKLFYDRLGDRISEIHLSGFDDHEPHIPLYKTKQVDIIKSVVNPEVPIIIESEGSPEEIKAEIEFIKNQLN